MERLPPAPPFTSLCKWEGETDMLTPHSPKKILCFLRTSHETRRQYNFWNSNSRGFSATQDGFPQAIALYRLPYWLSGKESACSAENSGSVPGLGGSPGEGYEQPTLVFLPGKSHGQRSLVGYNPWGRKRVRRDWATKHNSSIRLHSFHGALTALTQCNACSVKKELINRNLN